DQNVIAAAIERRQDARQSDYFGPGTDHREDFELAHLQTSLATVSGLLRSYTSFAHSITIISSLPTFVMSCDQPGMVSTICGLAPDVFNSMRSSVSRWR